MTSSVHRRCCLIASSPWDATAVAGVLWDAHSNGSFSRRHTNFWSFQVICPPNRVPDQKEAMLSRMLLWATIGALKLGLFFLNYALVQGFP